ncbi:MAG TPA: RDD family protein [Candidatus Competibacteraceae bacterium]|nr:RDD family protein [Candidatus Competibacteraceae bacterium]
MSTSQSTLPLPHAGLLPRLGAMLYDSLLLLALWLVATALLLPFTGGEAIAPGNRFYFAYLVLVSFAFLGGFWVHGGQTLGMRAWRLRVQQHDGRPLTWRHALLRFLLALLSWLPLGLGYWWLLVDPERMTWHDRWSGTVVVRLPR